MLVRHLSIHPLNELVFRHHDTSADSQRGEVLASCQLIGCCTGDSQYGGNLRHRQHQRQVVVGFVFRQENPLLCYYFSIIQYII